MNDRALQERELELAALYALSALSGAEMAELEREQRDNQAFWDEVRSLRNAAAGLAEAGPRAKPGRDLWPDVSRRIQAGKAPDAPPASRVPPQVWKQWQASGKSDRVVPAAEGAFDPTDIAGIWVRRLSVDEAAERVTMLIRMEAGTAYPAHRHGGAEECYVLEGDLRIGEDVEMRAGDYQRMDSGSLHPVQSTRGGCLLFITSSQHDELIE
jgi:quercetin dioxygenase-like cupin family protein